MQLHELKEQYKNELNNKKTINNIYNAYRKVYNEIINNYYPDIDVYKDGIYKLTNTVTGEIYIGSTELTIKKKKEIISDIIMYACIDQLSIDYQRKTNFRLDKLMKLEYTTFVDLNICLDGMIIQNGGLNNNYRDNYFVIDNFKDNKRLYDEIFSKVTTELWIDELENNVAKYYPYGFVYRIYNKLEKKSFIGWTYETTIKSMIINLYEYVAKYNKKKSVLANMLLSTSYKNLEIKIIEDSKIKKKFQIDKYIERYNTIKNGYNSNLNTLFKYRASNKYKK